MNSVPWTQKMSKVGEPPRRLVLWLRTRIGLLVLGMVASISVVAAVSMWDVKRGHAESMDDFGHQQELLARALASQLQSQLAAARPPPGDELAVASAGLRK